MVVYQEAKCYLNYQFQAVCPGFPGKTLRSRSGSGSFQCSMVHHLRAPTHTWFKARGIKKRGKKNKSPPALVYFALVGRFTKAIKYQPSLCQTLRFTKKVAHTQQSSCLPSNRGAQETSTKNTKSSWGRTRLSCAVKTEGSGLGYFALPTHFLGRGSHLQEEKS